MFVMPNTSVPDSVIVAAQVLKRSNDLFEMLHAKQREAFNEFWRPNGVLRSPTEINEILEAIDNAQPGQSVRLFVSAKELAELLLSISPDSLGADDWQPPYEYTVNETTGQLRVIV